MRRRLATLVGAILIGLLALAFVFGFVNRAFLHLPNSVGLLLFGLIASMLLVAVELLFPDIQLHADIETTLRQIDFGEVVFDGMLAFLVFAGPCTSTSPRYADARWRLAISRS